MARPRTIKTPDGDIILSGFTTEKANLIETMLETLSGVSSAARGPIESVPLAVPFDDTDLTAHALGMVYNKEKKYFELSEFKYNPENGMVILTKKSNAGEYKAFANATFRVACVEKGLI